MAAAKGEDGIENHRSGPRPDRIGDLTTCDGEPIHIRRSIQPQGVLFSLDEDSLSVLQASKALPELLGPEKGEDILQGLRNPFLNKSPSTSVLSR